jgi:hypothetical protein
MDTQTSTPGRVTGIFHEIGDADRVYSNLLSKGYTREDITVVMTDQTHQGHSEIASEEHSEHIESTHALDDAGRGALLGGTAGAIVSAIAVIGSNLALPGFGLVLMGPLLAALTGAAAGSLAGGTIGAIIGSGYPKEHAEYYESAIKEGGVMISVSPRDKADQEQIIEAFKACNGQSVFANDHVMTA